jgi:alkyl hydroperoxide reductase subunit AhpC
MQKGGVMSDKPEGCVKPSKGPIVTISEGSASSPVIEMKEASMTQARVGKPAPDFELSSFFGEGFKNVKLSDYKGKWIVICFYPGDFTFVWPTELTAVAVKYSELQELGVEVFAISTDSRFSHKIWQEEELSKMVEGGVPFPLLSDAGGRVGSIYGVYDEEAGVDIRGRFLIDPDFNIRSMEVMTPEVGRNVLELIRQVKAFQHVRATGEVTPAGWQPGKATLKPGPELAGKVWKVWKPDQAF